MPKDHPDGDGDIERMLGAELRNLQGHVGSVHNPLVHTIDLIAENQGVFLIFIKLRRELLQADGIDSLLHADDSVTF